MRLIPSAAMSTVRTRFAPSPTGFLHIGGARTALFNWAFTRRARRPLLLRIEDTDRERSTARVRGGRARRPRVARHRLGRGPLSPERARRAPRAAIERLLAKDRAYRCICTPAEIEVRRQATSPPARKWTYDGRCRDAALRPRLRPPHRAAARRRREGKLGLDDLVFGPSGQDAREIGDMIIRRSDGSPLYHLAVVVDDIDMGITHVIRGADHHSNTPFQLALYRALGATPPLFAHVPLIVGRRRQEALEATRSGVGPALPRRGYLPEAMLNWLARIGWSHGDQEIFSRDEIARALRPRGGAAARPAQADPGKLVWLNQHYIKELPRERLVRELLPFLDAAAGTPVEPSAGARRARRPAARAQQDARRDGAARALLRGRPTWRSSTKAGRAKHLKAAARARGCSELPTSSRALATGSVAAIEARLRGGARAPRGLALGKLAQPVRVAVTGATASPGIFETLASARPAAAVGCIARSHSLFAPAVEERRAAGTSTDLALLPGQSNGRTTGSGPVYGGSNPSRGTSAPAEPQARAGELNRPESGALGSAPRAARRRRARGRSRTARQRRGATRPADAEHEPDERRGERSSRSRRPDPGRRRSSRAASRRRSRCPGNQIQ